MRGSAYLLRRSDGRYYFRRKVPPDLIETLGKQEVRFSLRTSDPKRARELAMIEAVKVDQMLSEARSRLKPGREDDEEKDDTALTAARLDLLRKLAKEETLAELRSHVEADPLLPYRTMGDEDALAFSLDLIAEPWLEVAAGHHRRDLEKQVADLLRRSSVDMPAKRDDREALRRVIALAVLEGLRTFKTEASPGASDQSPFGEDNAALAATASAAASETLTSIFALWCNERQPALKTRTEFDTAVRLFVETAGAGDLPVAAITKQHVRVFKEALISRPGRAGRSLAPASINKHLGALSALLQWSIKNGYREGISPTSGMQVRDHQPGKDKRLPFDKADLIAIFSSPVFAVDERPSGGCGEAAYWLPVLALFTGARLEELGQLTAGDIRSEDGIIFMDLNTVGEGKRLKTQGSKRKVPLHPEVLRLDFLEFVARRGQERERLFCHLKPDRRGALTGNFSKWFGRYLRQTIGIKDERKVFHSFRHSFKDACRRARIATEVHDALTGHAGRNVGAMYGGEFPLETLGEVVGSIRFDGIEGLLRRR